MMGGKAWKRSALGSIAARAESEPARSEPAGPPRIAHLVFDLIRGGTEGQCARVAMGLALRGGVHRVAVFHRHGFFLEAVESACGPVREVAIRHVARPATVREVARLAAWLRQEQIELLHAWDADAAIFGQFAARGAGIPLVTSRRDLGQIYPRWKLALMRRADRKAVRVAANAAAVRDHFAAQGLAAGKIEVLPNLLDVEEFDRLAQRPFSLVDRLPAGRCLVVVNRLDPEKNVGLLIEALPRVREEIPDAVLVVAARGLNCRRCARWRRREAWRRPPAFSARCWTCRPCCAGARLARWCRSATRGRRIPFWNTWPPACRFWQRTAAAIANWCARAPPADCCRPAPRPQKRRRSGSTCCGTPAPARWGRAGGNSPPVSIRRRRCWMRMRVFTIACSRGANPPGARTSPAAAASTCGAISLRRRRGPSRFARIP